MARPTLICKEGFNYGDIPLVFYKKQCIKVMKNGRHELLLPIKRPEVGEGIGFQVTDFTWISWWIIKASLLKTVNSQLKTDLMDAKEFQKLII